MLQRDRLGYRTSAKFHAQLEASGRRPDPTANGILSAAHEFMVVLISHVKIFLRPVRPFVRPILGFGAPFVRLVLRATPKGRLRCLFWDAIGSAVCAEPWSFTTRTAHGFLLRGNTRDYLDRRLYYFGLWEPNLSTWIARTLRPGDTFVDVGANIGYFSLLAAQLVGPAGQVVAIEASRRIFADLQRNIALNAARNVRPIMMAVSDREAELPLYEGPRWHSGTTSVISQAGLSFGGTIGALPLPAILSADEFARCRLFKIDVEGAEWLVVRGFADALGRTRPDAEFVVEISPSRLAAQGHAPNEILDVFRAAGFNAYQIANDYSVRGYLDPEPYQAPRRLVGPIEADADIVFSRSDRAAL